MTNLVWVSKCSLEDEDGITQPHRLRVNSKISTKRALESRYSHSYDAGGRSIFFFEDGVCIRGISEQELIVIVIRKPLRSLTRTANLFRMRTLVGVRHERCP